MAANIFRQVPGVLHNRGALLLLKSELSVSFSFPSTMYLKGQSFQSCVPLTTAFVNGSGSRRLPLAARNNNFIVYAESVNAVPESEDEIDIQNEVVSSSEDEIDIQNEVVSSDEALEVSEEPKPSPRKTRVKLGQIIEILNKRAVEAVQKERPTPDIRTGDIVEIRLEVPENKRRVSVYKGIVMSRQNAGIHTTIRIRRIIAGVGVEIVFPLYSPNIKEIKVIKHRKVRRARLYYLREKLPRFSTFK